MKYSAHVTFDFSENVSLASERHYSKIVKFRGVNCVYRAGDKASEYARGYSDGAADSGTVLNVLVTKIELLED